MNRRIDWYDEVVVDLGLVRKFDEWLACKSEGERLWLEIKRYIAENRITRNQVRYTLAEKGIVEGRGKPGLFDVKPRKKLPPLPTVVFNIGKYDRDLRKHEVYIGRRHPRFPEGSIWGNPFKIGRDGTREEVVAKFEAYILAKPRLLAQLHKLKGKRLCCWCAPKPCHGDVLARLADASSSDERSQ
jgi:Domain of unknown function (DUF4326)